MKSCPVCKSEIDAVKEDGHQYFTGYLTKDKDGDLFYEDIESGGWDGAGVTGWRCPANDCVLTREQVALILDVPLDHIEEPAPESAGA